MKEPHTALKSAQKKPPDEAVFLVRGCSTWNKGKYDRGLGHAQSLLYALRPSDARALPDPMRSSRISIARIVKDNMNSRAIWGVTAASSRTALMTRFLKQHSGSVVYAGALSSSNAFSSFGRAEKYVRTRSAMSSAFSTSITVAPAMRFR